MQTDAPTMPTTISQTKFINHATAIYGSTNDYSHITPELWAGPSDYITVVCHEHGEFGAHRLHHISKRLGCPTCRTQPSKTPKADFVRQANQVHAHAYDYSKVDYVGSMRAVIVICPKHGEFTVHPVHHLKRKDGCPHCVADVQTEATAEFVCKARAVHADTYDYSRCVFVNTKTPVDVVCPEHGVFVVNPAHHINRAQGCPTCKDIAKYKAKLESTQRAREQAQETSRNAARTKKLRREFINKATALYKNANDYTNIVYVNAHTPVTVYCRTHGEFSVYPTDHLNKGQSCPTCAKQVRSQTKADLERAAKLTLPSGKPYDGSHGTNPPHEEGTVAELLTKILARHALARLSRNG